MMQKFAKMVYQSLFQGQSDAKATLLANSDSLFGILQLGLLLGDLPKDQEIINCLAEKSNSMAFNDKHLTALMEVDYFKSFYQNADEETILEKVLPTATTVIHRAEHYLKNYAVLVDCLSFKISPAGAKQLVSEVLTIESLGRNDPDVRSIVTNVC